MLAFLREHNATWQSFLGTGMSNAECTHDQATLQHIVMNRSKPQFAGLRLMLDSSSSFFLNLHECSSGKHWQMRNLSSCYRSRHRPLAHAVLDNSSSLWFKPGLMPPTAFPADRMLRKRDWNRPLIAHAPGDHKLLSEGSFFERLRAELIADKSLLDYPVHLVDPADGGPCATSTIGELFRVRTGNR